MTPSNVVDFRLARLKRVARDVGIARQAGQYGRAQVLMLLADEIFEDMKRPQRPRPAPGPENELLPAFLRRQAD